MRIIATLSQIFVREYQPAIARMLLAKKKRIKVNTTLLEKAIFDMLICFRQ